MKWVLVVALLLGTAVAQEPTPSSPEAGAVKILTLRSSEPSNAEIKALLLENRELLLKQNALLEELAHPPKPHHRKIVVVLQHILPIVDHTSSAFTVLSYFGVTK